MDEEEYPLKDLKDETASTKEDDNVIDIIEHAKALNKPDLIRHTTTRIDQVLEAMALLHLSKNKSIKFYITILLFNEPGA